MRHHLFIQSVDNTYPVALLMKGTAFRREELQKNYVTQLKQLGVGDDNVIAFTLEYDESGKAPVKHIKDYLLQSLLPALNSLQTKYLYCADSAFFKVLVGQAKADVHAGYVLPCKLEGYSHMNVVLGLNYQQLIYNPDLREKLNTSLFALASHFSGSYQAPGTGIITQAVYPEGHQAIQEALEALLEYPVLSADIEAFSLRFNKAGVGTMGFAIDKHNFVAFPCDYKPNDPAQAPSQEERRKEFGRFEPDYVVRGLIRDFLTTYQGKLIWHRAAYDLKVLIYTLWMKSLDDTEGLLEGLEVVTRLFDDTLLIAYLATNSTAGNVLGLKPLAHEFAGNYAVEDIKDIKMIPLPQLLQYNGVDCLSTWFVHEKYYPIMVADKQEHIYKTLFLPSVKTLLQMELTGAPMGVKQLKMVKEHLEGLQQRFLGVIRTSPLMVTLEDQLTEKKWEKDYQDRKAKAKNPEKIMYKDRASFPRHEFNPNSDDQKRELLYDLMGLKVIDTTDSGAGSTGAETLEKLINHVSDQPSKDLIQALMNYSQVSKILSTFIPAFEEGIAKSAAGIIWLHGSFNLGGTVSGRLSSSDPNLQNIPSNVVMIIYGLIMEHFAPEIRKAYDGNTLMLGKLVKMCFVAPAGWLMVGADFNSLEDYISALTTRDPNKLIIYEQGYDSHTFRAISYFPDEMPDISLASPGDRCFCITDENGKVHFVRCGTLVTCPDGEARPVEEYFAMER